MAPRLDPNFPENLLKANGIKGDRLQTLVNQFNLGRLPNIANIQEPKMRNLIANLKSHPRYGHLKPKSDIEPDTEPSEPDSNRTQA